MIVRYAGLRGAAVRCRTKPQFFRKPASVSRHAGPGLAESGGFRQLERRVKRQPWEMWLVAAGLTPCVRSARWPNPDEFLQ